MAIQEFVFTDGVVAPTPSPAYFTVAELRARRAELKDATTYPDDRCEAARVYAEARFENLANAAYVPRTVTEHIIGTTRTSLFTSAFIEVTAISAVKIDGVAMAVLDLAALKLRRWGEVIRPIEWGDGVDVEITYTHGFTVPPEPVKQAVLTLAVAHLVASNIPDRATVMTTDVGSFRISIADITGKTGIPEVDSVASPSQFGFAKPAVG